MGRAASLYDPSKRRSSAHLESPSSLPSIYVTTRSFAKLESLARLSLREGDPLRGFLLGELDRAIVLAEVGAAVVEVGDRVVYRAHGSRTPENRRLVYPGDRHPAGDAIPLLSPVGIALLGLKEGSGMAFSMPDGTRGQVRVVKVATTFGAPTESQFR